jgi:hypothetical protein
MASRIFVQNHCAGSIAVTLTLKQTFEVKTNREIYFQHIDKDECRRIAIRFKNKLNQAIFGNAAKRFNKSLAYLISFERGSGGLNYHLHIAIGNLPNHIKFSEFSLIVKSIQHKVPEINKQIDVQICDSGWSEYVVKESQKTKSQSIFWDLL